MPRKTAPALPYTVMTLACDVLQVDTGIQPRLALDSQTVETYATLYKEAEEGQDPLEPLDVFQVEGIYSVADGFHRLAAARRAGRETLPCHVYAGTHRDAMVHAAFANVRRGLPYSYGDKQQILERLLADPEIAARGDRSLARDLGMSHMTVWRTRARLEEEARLRAEIAALPASATGPKAREQQQLAAYLGVPVDTIKHSLGTSSLRYESPQAIIKELARSTVANSETPEQTATFMARNVTRVADLTSRPPSQTPRPSMRKEAIAARKEEARCEVLFVQLYRALNELVKLYPFTPEEGGYEEDDPSYALPPTAEELVAAVLPKDVAIIETHLTQARTVLDSLWSAWDARRQETVAR